MTTAVYSNGQQIKKLITNGKCNPNQPMKPTGLCPIHYAASRGHLDLVDFLVSSCHVPIDSVDKESETALLKAAYAGHLSVIEYLIKSNANPIHKDGDGWTALHNACSFGNLAIVKYLVDIPLVNINVVSNQGHTPLMNAASKGHIDIVEYLLDQENIKINIKNKFGETAYDVAAAAGQFYTCQMIERHFPYVDSRMNTHVTIPILLTEKQNNIWIYEGREIENKSKVTLPNHQWFWLLDWTLLSDWDGDSRQWMRIMKKVIYIPCDDNIRTMPNHDSSSSSSSEDSDSNDEDQIQQASVVTTTMNIKAQFITPIKRTEWEHNENALDCRRCHKLFSFIHRKHHCRKCGQIICNSCSSHRVYLPPQEIITAQNKSTSGPQRICDGCIEVLQKEDDVMKECPVCHLHISGLDILEQEHHVAACLKQPASTIVGGVRFVVYKLNHNSTLIGQECVICFEEFMENDTVTRLNCMCSFHRHCINHWFSKGKECPVHSQ